MLKKVINRLSGSDEGNVSPLGNSTSQDNSTFDPTPNPPSNNLSLSPCSKKRMRSSSNSETDDFKRPNQNDSFLQELDNVPSDSETSVPVDNVNVTLSAHSNSANHTRSSDSSIFDQLDMPFDESTPYWVPFLFKAFD